MSKMSALGATNRFFLFMATAFALLTPLAWGQAVGKEAKGGPQQQVAAVERAAAVRPPSLSLKLPAPAGLPLLPLGAGGPSWLQSQQGPQSVGGHLLLPLGEVSLNVEDKAVGTTVEGAWQSTTTGRFWRVRATSPGADALRVRFRDFDVGMGNVWLHTANGQIVGPYNGKGISDDGDFWSDIVFGESAVIEYQPGWTVAAQDTVPFRIAAVGHIRGETQFTENEELRPPPAAKSSYSEIGEQAVDPKAAGIGIEKDTKGSGLSPRKNTALTPGRSVRFEVIDAPGRIDLEYWLDVGPDVSRVIFELEGDAPSAEDLDLYVRYGERIVVRNNRVVRDYSSRGDTGNESITLMRPNRSGGIYPNLHTGRYYVGIEIYGRGSARGTLTAHLVTNVPSVGGARLTQGRPSRFRLGPFDSGSGGVTYINRQYRLEVPANPTRVIFDMKNDDPSEDVDIFVRHGRPVEVRNGSVIRDHHSTGTRGDERIVITQPIPGTYYLALRLYGNARRIIAEGTVTGYVEADTPPPPPPTTATVSLTADPASIQRGESSTLRWTATNLQPLFPGRISPDVGVIHDPHLGGSRTVSPTSTTTYTITVTARGGDDLITDTATVTVTEPPNPPTVSLTAQPASIRRGESATLRWTSANATSVTIDQGVGAVATSGSRTVSPTSTTTYRITATGANNQTAADTATVTVTASPNTPVISSEGIMLATGTPVVSTISRLAIISVFGQNFATAGTQELTPLVESFGEITDNLANTCLEIDGVRAPMFAVTPTQINAQVPELNPYTTSDVQVTVIRNCNTGNPQTSAAVRVRYRAEAPAFFNFDSNPDGRNAIVALHGGGPGLAGPPGLIPGLQFTPAEPGGIVTFFGTGFGATNPLLEAGQIPVRALPNENGVAAISANVSFTIGEVAVRPEDVLYAGTTPCCAGLYQFTVRVPQGTPSGAAAVIARVSNDGVANILAPTQVSTIRGPYLFIR